MRQAAQSLVGWRLPHFCSYVASEAPLARVVRGAIQDAAVLGEWRIEAIAGDTTTTRQSC